MQHIAKGRCAKATFAKELQTDSFVSFARAYA